MDKNSVIGMSLIALLLLGYFYFFSPKPEPLPATPVKTETTHVTPNDSTRQSIVAENDSLLAQKYGDLSAFFKGDETATTIETNDVIVTFTNKGGLIKELELKHYKTYDKDPSKRQPLKLITPASNTLNLLTQYKGKEIDLYSLFYSLNQTKNGDTTVVSYAVKLADGTDLIQTYSIPQQGYEIGYTLTSKGLAEQLTGDNLTLKWLDIIHPSEKDLADTRKNTTITYYTGDGYDELSAASTGAEKEVITTPLKWVAVKEKFFLTSLIAKNNFAGGEVETATNLSDSSVVKRANITLQISKKSLADNTADFTLYAGPNDYQTIGKVTDGFAKNVYLGWPPVYWINKFAIFPVFHFLTKFITNYGLIIIILVILLKLVLFPLSYKSYLSMAKMKVLKPELDEIKARIGDDATKVQQEQLKLYQQVGVNPISGCVPVLLQMPILFAMFYLFPASIELRQQPFLWAEDLSTYDSLLQLPIDMPFHLGSHISIFTLLMTAATLISTWQNNQLTSVQGPMKSMSYIMPVIFFFVLNSFSAGLTFYYFVSTLVTFGQQAVIRRFVDDDKIKLIMEENRKKIAAGGGGGKSKFMNKLQDAMKASEEARKKADDQRKNKKK